jgi:hypothetical protein
MSYSNEVKNNLISILNLEIDKTDDNDFKARLFNEIQLLKGNDFDENGKRLKIEKLPVSMKIQNRIDFYKKLQLIYLVNFKYRNHCTETKEALDNKIAGLYTKIGKLVNEKYQYKQTFKN